MGYNRLAKPRVYTCSLRHVIARAVRTPSSAISLAQGTLAAGSAAIENLVAGSPLTRCKFSTNGSTTHVLIAFDLGDTSQTVDFLAVLNHNLAEAEGFVRVLHHTAAITSLTYGSATAVTLTRQVGSKDESLAVEVTNGDHVVTFTPVSGKRYWALEVQDYAAFAADLEIGALLLGNSWTAPYPPDEASWKPDQDADGISLVSSDGPYRHAHITWMTGGETDDLPFGPAFRSQGLLQKHQRRVGRRIWPMVLPLMADTDVFGLDFAAGSGESACFQDVLDRCLHGGLPCIVTIDSTSTTAGDYMYARLRMKGAPGQSFSQVYNLEIQFEEEF